MICKYFNIAITKFTTLRHIVVSFFLSIVSVILFFGCEEIIEFDATNKGGDLVIFGRITDSSDGNRVTVSITAPFDRPPIPVQFAEVIIYDEDGNSERFNETDIAGTYKSGNFILDRSPGKAFYLEVCTPNGKKYRSIREKMPESVAKDSVYFNVETESFITRNAVEVEETTINVFLDSDIERIDNEPVFLRWEVQEVYSVQEVMLPTSKFPLWRWNTCYITNPVDAQKFFLFDGSSLRNDKITELRIAKRPLDGSFAANHYFNVIQYSLSFESFDYWRKVSQLTDRVGSIFDSPPATLPSNIRNLEDSDEIVFGHFEVAKSVTSRFLVTKNDIPVDFDATCVLPPEINTVPFNCFSCLEDIFALRRECLNCLILKNSSPIRPDYF